MSTRGVITICRGRETYFDMAYTFALSMRRTNPAVPLAVVTDCSNHPRLRDYDHILPRRSGWGEGFMEKMYLPRYSPFERTLYLDVDMLAIRGCEWFWDAVCGQSLTTLARPVLREGYWLWRCRLALPGAVRLMCSPMDCDWLRIDVLSGRCAFEQEGRVYEPEVVHFSAGYTDYFHYRRERARLRAAACLPWAPAGIVSAAIAAVWNPAYAVEVAARRLARRVLRGERGPWRDVLPVSRYR